MAHGAGLSLERFTEQLARIAPAGDKPVSAGSHLIEDLEFDSEAFERLGLLLFHAYGIVGVSAEALPDDHLTVEAFFRHCILDVLGIDPDDVQAG